MRSTSRIITAEDKCFYPTATLPEIEDEHAALDLTKHLTNCTMHIVQGGSTEAPYELLTPSDRRTLQQVLPQDLFITLEQEVGNTPLVHTILLEYINFQLQKLFEFTQESSGIMKSIRDDMVTVLNSFAIQLGTTYEHTMLFPSLIAFDSIDWTNQCRDFIYHYFHKHVLDIKDAERYGSLSYNVHHTLPKQFFGKKISTVVLPEGAHSHIHHVSNPAGKAEQEAHYLQAQARQHPEDATLRQQLYDIQKENMQNFFQNSLENLPASFDKLWGHIISALVHHFVIAINHKNGIQRSESVVYYRLLAQLNPIKYEHLRTHRAIDEILPPDDSHHNYPPMQP